VTDVDSFTPIELLASRGVPNLFFIIKNKIKLNKRFYFATDCKIKLKIFLLFRFYMLF